MYRSMRENYGRRLRDAAGDAGLQELKRELGGECGRDCDIVCAGCFHGLFDPRFVCLLVSLFGNYS